MAQDHIIPPLAKIEFDIPGGRSFDQGMGIVPGMRTGSRFVATVRGRERMGWTIPAIEVTTQFNQWIYTAYKGVGAIDNRDLLM
jgi:hypothetical protein